MATGTIEDNEAIPVVSITPLNAVKAEGSGAFLPWTTYTFTVTRTGPTPSASERLLLDLRAGLRRPQTGRICPVA